MSFRLALKALNQYKHRINFIQRSIIHWIMSLIPAFSIGVCNAWLFMIIYPLQWIVVLILPKQIGDRTSHPAEFKNDLSGQVSVRVTEIFWVGATLYSIFLPLAVGMTWLYAGLGVFAVGLVILVWATLVVVRTAPDKPFTTGIYRFSRHPMYLSMIFVYLGVSIASASWLFLLITVITFFLQQLQMINEEKYCCRKFGDVYVEYMNRTPRWIGLPKARNRQ